MERKILKLSGNMRVIPLDSAGECIVESSPESGPDSKPDLPTGWTDRLEEVVVNVKAFNDWLYAQPDTLFTYSHHISFNYDGQILFTVGRDRLSGLLPPDEVVLGLCQSIGGTWRARLQFGQEGAVLWGSLPTAQVCILTRWTTRGDIPNVPFIKVPTADWLVQPEVERE